ncbi:MAG: helix-turn-helix domain-containing protein [Pseudomonadota bacterium]
MRRQLLLPPPDLAPWISVSMAIELDGAAGATQLNRFPALVGSMLTVVLCGQVALWPPPGGAPQRLPASFFTGPISAPLVSAHDGRLHCVAVGIRPVAASVLVGEGAALVADRVVPAAQVWGAAWARWEEAIFTARDDTARLGLLMRFVRSRIVRGADLVRRDRFARLEQAVLGQGVRGAARELGLSERQLERVFTANLGLRPKQFQRIARVEAVLREALLTGRHDAQLALRHGYYDQAHLARDFRALAGASLTELLAQTRLPRSEHWPLQVGSAPPQRLVV